VSGEDLVIMLANLHPTPRWISWQGEGGGSFSVTRQIDFNGTVCEMIAAVLIGVAGMEQHNRRKRQAASRRPSRSFSRHWSMDSGTSCLCGRALPSKLAEAEIELMDKLRADTTSLEERDHEVVRLQMQQPK
jgi:hypothetical protein